MMDELFIDRDGKSFSAKDIADTLRRVGAHDCDHLFIHSDIIFGKTPTAFNRREYLQILYEVLNNLGVKSLLIPTFTYSFCNHEVYDVRKSRTSMGALNEYIRKQDGRYRTLDPLLSVSVSHELRHLFDHPSNHSLGEGSALDTIHHMDGVKFLFLGIPMGECFTYLHYIEKMLDVPYRFDLPFEGEILDYEGNRIVTTQSIHTACYGVKPKEFYHFEDYLEDRGRMKKERLGDKFVECVGEKEVYEEIVQKINSDINYFLERPFTEADLEHRYTKGEDGVRITHC